jgi:hypothetical protein
MVHAAAPKMLPMLFAWARHPGERKRRGDDREREPA